MLICKFTGKSFEISSSEKSLREKLGISGEPDVLPAFRFLQLGAFWQHWTLHKRKDDYSGKNIISVFGPYCPYPVWHKDEWAENANPPGADFDTTREIFPQLWEFFQKSPIPHNIGTGNENCEYTDDWWYSKNCYLCHSGLNCENLRYCYRVFDSQNCQFCVFSGDLQFSVDLVNCKNCFQVKYALNCELCRDSAFLYDCRNTTDSLFCWNLRNKQYCYFNQQLTKEEFEEKKREWDFGSRKIYENAKGEFKRIMKEKAFHRASQIDLSEKSSGDYLDHCKNVENGFFDTHNCEDCVNVMRASILKDCLDSVCVMSSELVYLSSMIQDQCYDVKFSYNLIQCKFAEYSAHSFQCENIFGCCGLVGKKYYIFNKPYSPEEYKKKKAKIIEHMKATKEYGQFFPGYFAANPYEESLSSFYFSLNADMLRKFGFRTRENEERRESQYVETNKIPDSSDEAINNLSEQIFWDPEAERPFQIQKADIEFAQKLRVPLPDSYYTRRIQENFRWMPFNGTNRATHCAKCQTQIQTSWPAEYDKRLLCEECYVTNLV